jgi:predicted phage baseplate assembly protein
VSLRSQTLDDRDFQTLVTEARTRIADRCPEWNEHNVSDPGITLIELFAHMTEQLIYRVNRIPERVHVALLDLLDIQLAPPVASNTLLRFRLAVPATEPLTIEAFTTEVSTAAVGSEDPIVFHVDDDFTILPLRPVRYGVRRPSRFEWVAAVDGVVWPTHPAIRPFTANRPTAGDVFYLGFDRSIAKLLLRVKIDVSQAYGSGVEPRRPPLRWEASCGDLGWKQAEVLDDTTDGLNIDGYVELQMPQETAEQTVDDVGDTHWLRCSIDPDARVPPYTRSPIVNSITAEVVGAAVNAVRAVRHEAEEVGVSDGTPGQVFRVANVPALELDDETEYLEVLPPGASRWQRWRRVSSFRRSDHDDKHFRFDPAVGEIELGPRIRRREVWRQHGAVPPRDARLRLSGYREGAQHGGNVEKDTLTVIRTGIKGVSSVTNPRAAEDGVGAEELAAARERAALELASSRRAVTAEDYAFLAGEASPNVGRADCAAPARGEPVVVRILPRLALRDDRTESTAAVRYLEREELTPDPPLIETVRAYLDERRVLGTSLDVQPMRLLELSVVVQAVRQPLSRKATVEAQVREALYRFLNPFVGGFDGEGWPPGRPVNQGDLFAVVQGVADVVEVRMLRLYRHDASGRRVAVPPAERVDLAAGEVVMSGKHDVLCEAR